MRNTIEHIREILSNYVILCKHPIGLKLHLYDIEDYVKEDIKKEFSSFIIFDKDNKLIIKYMGVTIIFNSNRE